MWKNLTKKLKLSENYLSMLLGFFVVVVLGIFVFNIFKGEGAKNQEGEISTTSTTSEENQEGSAKTHTVAKGENLWQISEQYYNSGYNWVDIAEANNLSNPNLVEEGQVLVVPSVEPKLPETGMTEESQGTNIPETYTVAHGDTLWSIAVKVYNNGYRWVDIAKENNLSNPDYIHTGNELKLPR